MSLWDWIVAAYARPGVAETCLRLQDEFGQNTSLLLWAWRAAPADPALLASAAAAARAWEETALAPLRAVRRALKAPAPPVADAAREALREDVKAAELLAERILVETLEGLGGAPVGGSGGLDRLIAVAQTWGRPAPDAALASLAAALE
jgi:uncharacterized protein (TIGR02444 family)